MIVLTLLTILLTVRGGSLKPRRPFKKPTPDALAHVALRYLERFAATEASLRRVLKGRVRRAALRDEAFAADAAAQAALSTAIEAIIAKHMRMGVIDDVAYATMKVNALRRAGRSARRIGQTLAAKGIGADASLAALVRHEEDEGGDQEHAAALRFAQKKRLGPWRAKAVSGSESAEGEALERKRRNREIAVMARAGFSLNMIRKILCEPVDDF